MPGIEPGTSVLSGQRSTTELHAHCFFISNERTSHIENIRTALFQGEIAYINYHKYSPVESKIVCFQPTLLPAQATALSLVFGSLECQIER